MSSTTQDAAREARRQTRHAVCATTDLPPGERVIAKVHAFGREMEIGVFNVHGRYVAYRNACPHAGAPVCVGKVCGTTLPSNTYELEYGRDGEILRCPWHGWEFDLLNGQHLVDEKVRLRPYEVQVGEEAAAGAAAPEEDLQPFPVEVDGDTVYVLV